MNDRNPRWSTGTCLVCAFLGFTLGFLACHKVYGEFDKNNLTIPTSQIYTP